MSGNVWATRGSLSSGIPIASLITAPACAYKKSVHNVLETAD